MKLDTEEKRMAYFLGYVQALAERHAKEFGRDVEEMRQELLTRTILKRGVDLELLKKYNII